jgi:hypothetical protein
MRSNLILITSEVQELMDASDDFTIAWVSYTPKYNQHGVRIENIQTFVNESAYLFPDHDYSDLIPITVEHEVYEAWLNIKLRGPRQTTKKSNPRNIGHQMGVRQEFRLAQERGQAERYLELMKRWSQQIPASDQDIFWNENFQAYNRVVYNSPVR